MQGCKAVVFGALAQLGAHNTGSVGVRGSSPLRSTNNNKKDNNRISNIYPLTYAFIAVFAQLFLRYIWQNKLNTTSLNNYKSHDLKDFFNNTNFNTFLSNKGH